MKLEEEYFWLRLMIQETQKENHAAEDRKRLDQTEILNPDLDSGQ